MRQHLPREAKESSIFFVVSECLHDAAPVACTVGDGGFYPHRPVSLLIRMKARASVVRQLKVPVGFNAILPHGPPVNNNKEEDDKKVRLGSNCPGNHYC